LPEAVRRAVHGLRHQPAALVGEGLRRRDELSKTLEPLAPLRARSTSSTDCSTSRPRASGSIRVRPATSSRARHFRRGPSSRGASASTRSSPVTWARKRSSPAWSLAASSRSRATTRPTSRWPTARTSRGRARPRPSRWRSTRRWRSTACSTTAATSATRASSTASASRPPTWAGKSASADRAKLEEYLTSVREVERRVVPMRDAKQAAEGRAGDRGKPAIAMTRPDNGLPRTSASTCD